MRVLCGKIKLFKDWQMMVEEDLLKTCGSER
jgi:hypothetical protein